MRLECTELLRNEENYELDVLQANVSETGVNELVCLMLFLIIM